MERLRTLYESFFLGVERQPPNVPRREMNRLMLELQQDPISNSSMRFRFQTLMQRWVLFTAYWNRTLREIEAGTYRRDVARAQRHLAEKGGVMTEQEAINIGIPAVRAKAFVERQQRLASLRGPRPGAQLPAAPATDESAAATAPATATPGQAAAPTPAAPAIAGPQPPTRPGTPGSAQPAGRPGAVPP